MSKTDFPLFMYSHLKLRDPIVSESSIAEFDFKIFSASLLSIRTRTSIYYVEKNNGFWCTHR